MTTISNIPNEILEMVLNYSGNLKSSLVCVQFKGVMNALQVPRDSLVPYSMPELQIEDGKFKPLIQVVGILYKKVVALEFMTEVEAKSILNKDCSFPEKLNALSLPLFLEDTRVNILLAAEIFNMVRDGISDETKIFNLNLSNQNLKLLPSGLIKLKNLKFLNLTGNQFKEIPDFSQFASLEQVKLENNPIKKIPKDLFERLPKLRILTIDMEVETPSELLGSLKIIYKRKHSSFY